jgi:hypothetical protein
MQQHHQLRRREQLRLLELLNSNGAVGRSGLAGNRDDRIEDGFEDVALGGLAVKKGDNLGQVAANVGLLGEERGETKKLKVWVEKRTEGVRKKSSQLVRSMVRGILIIRYNEEEETHLVHLRYDRHDEPRVQIPLRHQTLYQRDERHAHLYPRSSLLLRLSQNV